MQAIAIQTPLDYGTDISVVIDGECNHAGAVIEDLEYSKDSWWSDAGMYVPDDTVIIPTLVCNCGYKEIYETDYDDYDDYDTYDDYND